MVKIRISHEVLPLSHTHTRTYTCTQILSLSQSTLLLVYEKRCLRTDFCVRNSPFSRLFCIFSPRSWGGGEEKGLEGAMYLYETKKKPNSGKVDDINIFHSGIYTYIRVYVYTYAVYVEQVLRRGAGNAWDYER